MCKSPLPATLGGWKDERDSLGPLGFHMSFPSYLLRAHSRLVAVVGMGDAAINEADRSPVLSDGETDNKEGKMMHDR